MVCAHKAFVSQYQAIHCLDMYRVMHNHCHHHIFCRYNTVDCFDPRNYEIPVAYILDAHPQYTHHVHS